MLPWPHADLEIPPHFPSTPKVVLEGRAVTITAQPFRTTLSTRPYTPRLKDF